MKKIKSLCWLLLLSTSMHSQNASNNTYLYSSPHYYESIQLLSDGTFKYYQKTEFIKSEINGNWKVMSDSVLVLDSRPRKSKLTVFESFKLNKKITFRIRDTKGDLIHYNIYLISDRGDTIAFKEQFDKTVTMGRFSSFYIVNTRGLLSPIYKINSTRSNFFEINMEQQRVFENESWLFYGRYIVPLGVDNKYTDYKLEKQ